jgi:photosystem II stability/assembly factor-like uncharacterized protein
MPAIWAVPGTRGSERAGVVVGRRRGASAGVVVAVILLVVAACGTPGNRSQAARTAGAQVGRPTTAASAPSGRLGFDPDGVAFWDAESGLLVATVTTPACLAGMSACPGGLVERTADGGRIWEVVDRVGVPLNAVAVTGGGVAWVTSGRCGPASPDACGSAGLLVTTDWGRSWARVRPDMAVTSVSPLSAAMAWAVQGEQNAAVPLRTGLVETTDGGRSWRRVGDPCTLGSGGAAWSVDFATPASGWVLCVSQPATDMQPKALYAMADGGATWHLKSATTCGFQENGQRAGPVGTLPCVGYLPGMDLLADGHGWEWADRAGLAATSDGGFTWAALAAPIVSDDINSVVSASLVSDTTGFLLISHPETQKGCPPEGCGPRLLSTTDGGRAWTTLVSWPSPSP